MKYTIELTDNQKKQMDFMLDMANKHMGFNRKLEMIETTNVEDTNEYQIGYKVGYVDGKKFAYGDAEFIQKAEYNKGYNSAINDYNAMYEWLHDCTEDFRTFLVITGYYESRKDVSQTASDILYDLICDHDIAEVISEFKKWQEEKKKADEIKVGDVVKFNEKCRNYDHVKSREYLVLHIFDNEVATILYDNGDTGATEISLLDKTGRHIDEVEQLLDKLRGDENEAD